MGNQCGLNACRARHVILFTSALFHLINCYCYSRLPDEIRVHAQRLKRLAQGYATAAPFQVRLQSLHSFRQPPTQRGSRVVLRAARTVGSNQLPSFPSRKGPRRLPPHPSLSLGLVTHFPPPWPAPLFHPLCPGPQVSQSLGLEPSAPAAELPDGLPPPLPALDDTRPFTVLPNQLEITIASLSAPAPSHIKRDPCFSPPPSSRPLRAGLTQSGLGPRAKDVKSSQLFPLRSPP